MWWIIGLKEYGGNLVVEDDFLTTYSNFPVGTDFAPYPGGDKQNLD